MAALRRIGSSVLQQLKSLLADNKIAVNPISVEYKDYSVHNKSPAAKEPLEFQWIRSSQVEWLYFGFYTWGTVESKKFPDTFLALGTASDFRIVGFPLYLLPQDKEFVYLSFKLGNNEGGKTAGLAGAARLRNYGRSRKPTS